MITHLDVRVYCCLYVMYSSAYNNCFNTLSQRCIIFAHICMECFSISPLLALRRLFQRLLLSSALRGSAEVWCPLFMFIDIPHWLKRTAIRKSLFNIIKAGRIAYVLSLTHSFRLNAKPLVLHLNSVQAEA